MRWEDVLADVEGQLDAALALDLAAEVSDRSRREMATVSLRERLLPAVGHPLEVATAARRWQGRLARVGADWLLLDLEAAGAAPGDEVLVPLARVLWIVGLGRQTAVAGPLAARLGLGHALRRLARDRLPVTLILDGSLSIRCRVGRVGADFVETVDDTGDATDVRASPRLRTVPLAAVTAVLRSA